MKAVICTGKQFYRYRVILLRCTTEIYTYIIHVVLKTHFTFTKSMFFFRHRANQSMTYGSPAFGVVHMLAHSLGVKP